MKYDFIPDSVSEHTNVYDVLKERGFIEQSTDEEKVRELLQNEKVKFYIGFDPTADCLHVGHFMQVIIMMYMQKFGHTPVVLLGGGTGFVGDPSGRTDMRQMMTAETIESNCEAFKKLFDRFLDFDEDWKYEGNNGVFEPGHENKEPEPGKAISVNNARWLLPLNYIGTAESADSPYTLTLGQVFNDGDWLRISLMLTSEDDSLAGFNAIGPREDAVEKAMQSGGGQYGTLVLDNGIELSGGINFEKRDDHTFVAGLNYELFLTHDDLAGHTATLTLSNLMVCNRSTVETDGKSYWHYDYADQTPLPGTYTLTFTIPEVSDAGVRTMSTPVEQDGVTLQSIKATPAATKVLLTFPPEQHWVSVKLYTADGTELGHERGEGGWWTDGAWTADPADFDHPEQYTKASYDYFAAVPENCHSLTVKVYDFDTDAELTTFTAELP